MAFSQMGKRTRGSDTVQDPEPSWSEGETTPPQESSPEQPSKRSRVDNDGPAMNAEGEEVCRDCALMWWNLAVERKENLKLERKLEDAERRVMELELRLAALERAQAKDAGGKEARKRGRLQVPQKDGGVKLNEQANGMGIEGVDVGVPLASTSSGSSVALAAESCQSATTICQEDNPLTGIQWLKEGITSIIHQARNGSSPSAPTRRYRLVDVETNREVNHSDLSAPTVVYRLEADAKDGPTAPTLFGSSTLAELAVFEKTKRIQSGVKGTFCFYESFEALVAHSSSLVIHSYAHHASTETLLLSPCMKAWAKKKGSRGVITCGHHGLNDLIPMVQALNAVAGEDANPMTLLPIEMPDQSTMHSKAITGYDSDTDSIITLIGSANLSKLGMGVPGTKQTGHVESGTLDVLPANSITGTAWLNTLERFHREIYQAGRMIEAVATKTERPADPDVLRLTSELNAAKKQAAKSKPLAKPAPLSLQMSASTATDGSVVVSAGKEKSATSSLHPVEQLPHPTKVGALVLHGLSTAASAQAKGTVFGARVCIRCFESILVDQAATIGVNGGKQSKVKHPSSATKQPTPPCSAQGRLGEEYIFVPLDRSKSPPIWESCLQALPLLLSSVGLTVRLPNVAMHVLRGIEYGWYASLKENVVDKDIYSSFKRFARDLATRCPLLEGSIDSLTNPAIGKWLSERLGPDVYLTRKVVNNQGSKSHTTVVAGRGKEVLQHFLSVSSK